MASVITDLQRVEIRDNARFQSMVRAAAANYAVFIHNNDGAAPPGSMTRVEWAKQRFFIAEPILQHPKNQDDETWYSQAAMLMKDMAVWNGTADATVDFMITANTFATLAEQTFTLRAANVTF